MGRQSVLTTHPIRPINKNKYQTVISHINQLDSLTRLESQSVNPTPTAAPAIATTAPKITPSPNSFILPIAALVGVGLLMVDWTPAAVTTSKWVKNKLLNFLLKRGGTNGPKAHSWFACWVAAACSADVQFELKHEFIWDLYVFELHTHFKSKLDIYHHSQHKGRKAKKGSY